jgi:hypothetical protein
MRPPLEELLEAAPAHVGAGRQDPHEPWRNALNHVEELDAAKARSHVEIAHDRTELWPAPNQLEGLGCICGHDHVVSAGAKLAGDGARDQLVVIHDKHAGTIDRGHTCEFHYHKYKAINVPAHLGW